MKQFLSKPRGWIVVITLAVVGIAVGWGISTDGSLKQEAKVKAAEVIGSVAVQVLKNKTGDMEGSHGASVELIQRNIEVREIADNVLMAVGVGNVAMITTAEGNVVFDTGLVIQAAKQLKLLKERAPGPVKHVILSHSHADHVGGTVLWEEEGQQVIAHREFEEEQRYLKELQIYQHNRNRVLFPWIPAEVPDMGFLNYGNIKPNVLVDEGSDYNFTLGGVEFQVISTPGAEGADNIVLWLPQQKILFSGDFFGPQFPQFPNVFTMRGEKVRKPVEYIRSLNKIIALEPEMVVPSHFNPTEGRELILADLIKVRDAVQYVHDEVVAGMNAGKNVNQLMKEVTLPQELELAQNHGRVSWAVKSIWEYYASWFHFESTTELYPVPVREVYRELVEAAGAKELMALAQLHIETGEAVKAIHLMEVALSAGDDGELLAVMKAAHESLLASAKAGLHNDYEIYWLNAQLADIDRRIKAQADSEYSQR